ncbi:GAP family protein [Nonomuraea pusilla]|uniref:Sap, sulfolipid-1-addressing protein n=1 Tax=Nonomuraea pusilla TaxID=46177 RepID=A0A1H7WZR4_9ACTN|nr:GAP family protein [Nonomuraea pusilla]SEM27080.1 Sap, sulfolipid-1-addressing protein [Nonomuraea pusilla]
MDLQVLPLAVTMMAGPQIMTAIILVTHRQAVRMSLAYLAGVAIAAVIGTAIARWLAGLLGGAVTLGDPADPGSVGALVQVALVGLLIAFAVKNYLGRETSEPPAWLGTLLDAGPDRAFTTGLLLILVMPTDIMAMLTVGVHLTQHDLPAVAALPFLVATLLIAALPLLAYLVFHRRAVRAMPQVRDWMNGHGWLLNVVVCVLFIFFIL